AEQAVSMVLEDVHVVVDLEALEALLDHRRHRDHRAGIRLAEELAVGDREVGVEVVVDADGVAPLPPPVGERGVAGVLGAYDDQAHGCLLLPAPIYCAQRVGMSVRAPPSLYALLEDVAANLYVTSQKDIPPDVRAALEAAAERETHPTGKAVLKVM